MAFRFFKRNNKQALKSAASALNESVSLAKEPVLASDDDGQNVGFVMKTNMQVEYIVKEKFDVFKDSPLKVLHNMLCPQDEFQPMEYLWKAVIDTNLRINELGKDTLDEYVDFDDNQRDLINYIKNVQQYAVKFITQLLSAGNMGSLDDYSKDVNRERLEKQLGQCSAYNSYDAWKRACDPKSGQAAVKPTDSQVFAKVSRDRLHGWLIVFPPVGDGAHIQGQKIVKALEAAKIVSGINSPLITAITGKRKYFRIFEIARGEEVVHGKDGYVKDLYPRNNTIHMEENENGVVNFKELNNVRSVHKDDVICEIYYPVKGRDGKAVDGSVIAAKKGAQPKIPQGKNTVLSEDAALLLAAKNGELVYHDGRFCVNGLLTIERDVDNSVGNIHFTGDVLIKGDVREGFSVSAEGNVAVEGNCEGASISANGDVIIDHGMTGGGKGSIHAGQNLKCMFLENCKASAGKSIEVDLVMYSELSAGENITVSGSKGSVTGGKLIAGKKITADVIGALGKTTLKTEIVLGASPEIIRKHADTSKNLKEIDDKLFKMNQDICYIEGNIDRMPESRLAKLHQLKIQQKFVQMQREKLENTLGKMNEELEETKRSCSLTCKVLNPTVHFRVGDKEYTLVKQLCNARLGVREGITMLAASNLVKSIEF